MRGAVLGEVVEQVAEVDVGHVADRDHWEKPKPRAAAQSRTPVASAPDWVTKARLPAGGVSWAKLALMPRPGEMKPRQFGPDDAQQVRPRRVEHRLAQSSPPATGRLRRSRR